MPDYLDVYHKLGFKSFKVGDEAVAEKNYLASTPAVVIKDNQGEIVAFANMIPSYAKNEATIDLMRHKKDAPNGTMDFLFIKLFLKLKEQGFARFSLGLALMSGFSIGEQSTKTEKAVHQFAQNTNLLFNVKGLKAFKAKYADFWEPRYLIYRNIVDLTLIAKALNELSRRPK